MTGLYAYFCSIIFFHKLQTEEWKGWMQFVFLAYHYYHQIETYNAVRVFISCYVWMTGFGNFSFFYLKRDFSGVRMWQVGGCVRSNITHTHKNRMK